MQVPWSNRQQNIPPLEEFIIKTILFSMYEYVTSNSKDLPVNNQMYA